VKFSICIPNYNYERYLGRTIQSVLDQQGVDLEILISDNASTDGSLEVVREFHDERIRVNVNRNNVGFTRNLDRAAAMASGDYFIMLSSDDLIRPGALKTYQALLGEVTRDGRPTVVTSTWDVISSSDEITGRCGPNPDLWTDADRVPALDALAGGPVYRVGGMELFRRCLLCMKNPFNFAATCYSRQLYEAVDGYGSSRIMGPDKAFHWKLLPVVDAAYFVDHPWFAYRWHASNQLAQETSVGALKLLVDEYVTTLEVPGDVLERLGLSRDDVCAAFVEHDIGRHGLATLARGQRQRARRILNFGRATYPQLARRNRKVLALRTLLALGPVGQKIAERAYRSYRASSERPNGQ
jgi:glycosyltransferase involved in cell wall biosynthesis